MTIGVSLAYVLLSSIYSSVSSLLSHSWSQITVALSLVAFTSAVLQVLQLNVSASVAIAALRYMAQLIVVTFVLRYVFVVENKWTVARLARRFKQYCSESDLIVSSSTAECTPHI